MLGFIVPKTIGLLSILYLSGRAATTPNHSVTCNDQGLNAYTTAISKQIKYACSDIETGITATWPSNNLEGNVVQLDYPKIPRNDSHCATEYMQIFDNLGAYE
jgi:hypothetical protein